MTKGERFEGCIICGAIGDAFGSQFENQIELDKETFYLTEKPKVIEHQWQITDDTQLTLGTCEAIIQDKKLNPVTFANHFLKLFKSRKIIGIGASTLKALRELQIGGHWSQVGRKGEYAAGNGAAMRIAPIAFIEKIDRKRIREICFITHQNDEAYIGALCIIIAIQSILNHNWTGEENLLEIIIEQIPDTRVRDRLIEINNLNHKATLKDIGSLGNNGYVVNSIPLAISAANKINQTSVEKIFKELTEIGGDTDTNCSIAGQIIGTLIGRKNIPQDLLSRLMEIREYQWILKTIINLRKEKNWT